MRNKLLVIAVAVTMVTVFFPATQARHLSVGYRDAIATSAREDPNNPSVVGPDGDDDKNDTPYEVGTTNRSYCFEASSDPDAATAQEALAKDGFCGRLVYNHGHGNLKEISPPDQHYPVGTDAGDVFPGGPIPLPDNPDDDEVLRIERIDVVRTHTFWAGDVERCEPFCEENDLMNTTWHTLHDNGDRLDITEDGDTASDKQEGDRGQVVGVRPDVPYPNGLVQASLGLWAMNGWTIPPAVGGAQIGFVYDDEGQMLSDDDIEQISDVLKTRTHLPENAIDTWCGFTPDRTFQGSFTQDDCDGVLQFVNATAEGDPTTFDSYNEECASPTYFCGETQEDGYWEAESAGFVGAYSGRYQGEFTRWHWVLAPTPQDCGRVEPGFDPTPGTALPYLAHDLDVRTPVHYLAAADNPPSTANTVDYAEEIYYENSEDPEELIAAHTPGSGVLPPAVDAVADEATAPYLREDLTEPNLGDSGTSDLDDDSQQEIVLDRSDATECAQVTLDTGHHSPPQEPEQELDPWVNTLDASLSTVREASYEDPVVDSRTPPEVGRDTPTVGLYANGDASGQDASNDPTPEEYATTGTVGVFADGDDDGEYETVVGPEESASGFGASVFDSSQITSVGAYPMIWDMYAELDESTGEITVDTTEGCDGPGGEQERLPETASKAGYGPQTALVQAIYMQGSTEFRYQQDTTNDVATYPAGNNIYLLMNQVGHELWEGANQIGDTQNVDNVVDEEIDNLLLDLHAYLDNQQGLDLPALEDMVVVPNEDLELGQANAKSDFDEQCGESTGAFDSIFSFVHQCGAEPLCAGDTIATMYTFEVADTDGELGGDAIPALTAEGEVYSFGNGHHTWTDVDPFDGDPARNDETRANSPSDWCDANWCG